MRKPLTSITETRPPSVTGLPATLRFLSSSSPNYQRSEQSSGVTCAGSLQRSPPIVWPTLGECVCSSRFVVFSDASRCSETQCWDRDVPSPSVYLGQALFYNCDVSKVKSSCVTWRQRNAIGKRMIFEEVAFVGAATALKSSGITDERDYVLIAERYQQLKKNYDERKDYWLPPLAPASQIFNPFWLTRRGKRSRPPSAGRLCSPRLSGTHACFAPHHRRGIFLANGDR